MFCNNDTPVHKGSTSVLIARYARFINNIVRVIVSSLLIASEHEVRAIDIQYLCTNVMRSVALHK